MDFQESGSLPGNTIFLRMWSIGEGGLSVKCSIRFCYLLRDGEWEVMEFGKELKYLQLVNRGVASF